jgi:hypothetical protein
VIEREHHMQGKHHPGRGDRDPGQHRQQGQTAHAGDRQYAPVRFGGHPPIMGIYPDSFATVFPSKSVDLDRGSTPRVDE